MLRLFNEMILRVSVSYETLDFLLLKNSGSSRFKKHGIK